MKKPTAKKVKADMAKSDKQQVLTEEELRRKIEAAFKLSDVDRAILSVKIRYPGITLESIAEAIGYNRGYISERMNSPVFKAAMAEYTKNLIDALVDAQLEAVRRLKKEVSNPDPLIAISAAKALLLPLGRIENSAPQVQQNIVYSVKFGEGGQLMREMKPLTVGDFKKLESSMV